MQKFDTSTIVRSVDFLKPLEWLSLGWKDIARVRWLSLAHGLALTLAGGLIVAVGHHRFWLLAGALSGFLIVAPVLATSLFALSRALEREETIGFQVILKTWLHWQNSHFNKWGNDYWCMVQFGALLSLAATGWVLTSAALITLLSPIAIASPADFLRYVVLAPSSWLFEGWLLLGGVLAAPIFASSVVTMPLLLDRRVSLLQAVLISWAVVIKNPIPMAIWAGLIMGFTLLGLGSLLLGLVWIIPMLGHGSWYAYRALIDASHLPARSKE